MNSEGEATSGYVLPPVPLSGELLSAMDDRR
jgi:hypothetical protein